MSLRWLFCGKSDVNPTKQKIEPVHCAPQEKQEIDPEVKPKLFEILLFGSTNSGKSTIFNQMRFRETGLIDSEMQGYRAAVHFNVMEVVSELLNGAAKFGIPVDDDRVIQKHVEEFKSKGMQICSGSAKVHISPEIVKSIKLICQSRFILLTLRRKYELHRLDSAEYFLGHLDRIFGSDYVPTEMDVLRCHRQAVPNQQMHIVHKVMKHVSCRFMFYDMALLYDMRSARQKWMDSLSELSGLMFIVDVSAYNLVADETEPTWETEWRTNEMYKIENRLHRDLRLYEKTVNTPYIHSGLAIMLILNKVDVEAASGGSAGHSSEASS